MREMSCNGMIGWGLTLLSVGLLLALSGAEAADLKLKPQRGGGGEVAYELQVTGAEDLFAYQVTVTVPGSDYATAAVTEGSFLGSDGSRTLFIQKSDGKPGQWLIAGSRLGDVAGMAGKGVLATVTLRPAVDGANSRQARLELIEGESLLVNSDQQTTPPHRQLNQAPKIAKEAACRPRRKNQ